ncbi:MAG: hypothetical protein LBO20_02675, partial [Bifidobacteriaceae bacterium]|nr:hypothetical protein [Bifidobacteriaceae bacterium]
MGEPGPGSTLVDLADGALPASPSGSLSAGQQPMPSGGIAVRLAWTQSGLAGVGLEAAAELAEVGLGARLGRELGRGRGLDSRSPVEPAADRSASPAGAAPWRPNGGKPAGEATSAWARRMLEDEARRAGVIGPAEPAEWARDGAGRPVLDNAPNWHCSISHSGPLVAVAWARRPVGIDVELTSRRVSRAVRRRLAPDERAHI